MCDHCDVLTGVLTQLCGAKVAQVIMRRAVAELHGHEAELHDHQATLVRRDFGSVVVASAV